MRIVTFKVAEESMDGLVEAGLHDGLRQPGVEWGLGRDGDHVSSPVLTSSPSYKPIAYTLSGVPGAEEMDVTSEYVFGRTRAPESFDGFGTFTVSKDGEARVVAVQRRRENWQCARYHSGLGGYEAFHSERP